MVKTFKLGIEPLDMALPSGLPYSSLSVVAGPGGVGKSVMLAHIAWNFLKSGGSVVYVNFDDSSEAVLSLFRDFNWDIDGYVDKGAFQIIDCFSFRLGPFKKPVKGVVRDLEVRDLNSLMYAINDVVSKSKTNTLVILDSINEFMFKFEVTQVLDFIKTLRAVVAKGLGAIVLVTVHVTTEDLQALVQHLEYLVDGVIELRLQPSLLEIGIPVKELLVKKMRSVSTNPIWIPYVISDSGISSVDMEKLVKFIKAKVAEAETLKKLISG
ncbi:MAG: hypothetical protein B7O98_06485 [Zestosphaera tikiterensis]|uniref:KaiC-like domain-containing protein n=1 Tax=Zestosphaera tikiterensis TaxID=1973259 RepID=A0A2R7Y455_9CREN|nr:MAG: hypothetical protein B7O98_06485 [Zestosphaera tikiterensis]